MGQVSPEVDIHLGVSFTIFESASVWFLLLLLLMYASIAPTLVPQNRLIHLCHLFHQLLHLLVNFFLLSSLVIVEVGLNRAQFSTLQNAL